ncbi:MAG: Uncharacterised protein [Halieaceae bacterium]|nr:MAG: Uncharacterised protein [Halieaceae bacterium]
MIRLLQGTAAVIPEVNHQPLNVLSHQLCNQSLDIARGRSIVLVPATIGVEIDIKSRDIDYAYAVLLIRLIGKFDDLLLCGLLLKLDLIAPYRHHTALICLALAGDDFEPNYSIPRASNQIDYLIKSPAHNIFYRT